MGTYIGPTRENAQPIQAKAGESDLAVVISAVSKSFGPQRVLDGVSLNVRRGETQVVLGRSGTGKSVLLKIVVGLQKPDAGTVFLLGEDISTASAHDLSALRTKMGFLFQHAALYDSLTVEDNVAFPLTYSRAGIPDSEKRDRVRELLHVVGLDGQQNKMPSNISGGMQKRVGLARALALDPVVLLLDEPTAGLDPISSGEIDDLILNLQLKRRMATILVTHDLLSASRLATRIALLDRGQIAIEGTFDDLRKSDAEFVSQFFHRNS